MLPARFGFLALLACCVSLATASDDTCTDDLETERDHLKDVETMVDSLQKQLRKKDETIALQKQLLGMYNASCDDIVMPPSPPGLPPMPATPPSKPLPPSPPPSPQGPPSPPLSPDGLPCLRWTKHEEDPRLCRNYYSIHTALAKPDDDDDDGGGGGSGSEGSCPAGMKEAQRPPLWWKKCKFNNRNVGKDWGGNKPGGKCDDPGGKGAEATPCGTCTEPSSTAGEREPCGCSRNQGHCAIACGFPLDETAADVKSKCPPRPCTNMTSAAENCNGWQRECSNPTGGKNMCIQKDGHCEVDKCVTGFFRVDEYNCCPGSYYSDKQMAGLKCPRAEHPKKYKVAHCASPFGCKDATSDCGKVIINHASGMPRTLNTSNLINPKTFDNVCDNACKCNPLGLEPGRGFLSAPLCQAGGQAYPQAVDTCYCDGDTMAWDKTKVDLCGYWLPIYGKDIPGGQANAYKAYAKANGLKNNFPDDLLCVDTK